MSDATEGKWLGVANAPGDLRTLGDGEGVFAVHGALLKTGRVLLFSGRVESSEYLYRSWTWDPTTFSEGDTTLTGVEGRWFLSAFDPGGATPSPPGPVPSVAPYWLSEGDSISSSALVGAGLSLQTGSAPWP